MKPELKYAIEVLEVKKMQLEVRHIFAESKKSKESLVENIASLQKAIAILKERK